MSQITTNLSRSIGHNVTEEEKRSLANYLALKLSSSGLPAPSSALEQESDFISISNELLDSYRQKARLSADPYCSADRRIQNFIDKEFGDCNLNVPRLSVIQNTLQLDRHGMSRMLSIPFNGDQFISEHISSYRLPHQGVLHNPASDRRTTKGTFHIAQGGLPIPADKVSVPKHVFGNLLAAAFHEAPDELLELPYTSNCSQKQDRAKTWTSLLLRPIACPEVNGFIKEKRMEIRFFAPGSLVANADFLESIFGNAGNPDLLENDAALDSEHWTGTTGCIVLAPHIKNLTKKSLGLPHVSEATEEQKNSGMCWSDESELYHNGKPFKIVFRTSEGNCITILADNYFGYCKKEVKTMISMSCNFHGLCEEEHSGGALTTPCYNLGQEFHLKASTINSTDNTSVKQLAETFSSRIELKSPEEGGYGIDQKYPDRLVYVPIDSHFDAVAQTVTFNQGKNGINLRHGCYYMMPNGYVVYLHRKTDDDWCLVGMPAEPVYIHKPCTVSGGGKSELSKSISDSIVHRRFYVKDFEKDMDRVEELINYDYSNRFAPGKGYKDSRSILSSDRSLGSVIKLLNPSPSEFTDEYNKFLDNIPYNIKALVFLVKAKYKPEWGNDWRRQFSVEIVNGTLGNELKYHDRNVIASYLRVGFNKDHQWRIFKLRQDFFPAFKVQQEDDISASVTVPSASVPHTLRSTYKSSALKICNNCEYRFFQRPDDAVIRGFDKQAERDLSSGNSFISNFEAQSKKDAQRYKEDARNLHKWTPPIKDLVDKIEKSDQDKYWVSPAHTRVLADEGRSKNPRYLQDRQDLTEPFAVYLGEMSSRFSCKLSADKPLYFPVDAVLPGRRNNPPNRKTGIRSLAVYNPVHYQELPELFMDFVCCLTGKSPSTTGAGSEGALTKGPFNMLCATSDLNNALLSFILCGFDGFTSTAGYCGPNCRVDHDISLLVPEIWCRMSDSERSAQFLIENNYLERVKDFEYNGRTVKASRLGYRINRSFAKIFLGRIFDTPTTVFPPEMLQPESQDLDSFVDGVDNIVEAQERVARNYFTDTSVDYAIPPLKALLHIMAYGEYEGKDVSHPDVRRLFDRDYVLHSEWYEARLKAQQQADVERCQARIESLENCKACKFNDMSANLKIAEKLQNLKQRMEYIQSQEYVESLRGSFGRDIMFTG
eukprot:gb/GECH01014533.1/.p1 GENE.gb/GECH01014533.1/~~gb/GECH01014533.1/.p1  ORF type:complete len:1166 (+),score=281.23 gb/GECH01014533.1/:1-3498(+)